jgi:hypothetical protein
LLDAIRHAAYLSLQMTFAAAPGSNASATRAGSVSAASVASVRDALLVRLSGSIDLVGILPLVAVLLIGLILISAGCGPPN